MDLETMGLRSRVDPYPNRTPTNASGSLMSSEPFSSDLLKSRCLVHGQWACSVTGKTFSVNNPADGSLIGTVPDMVEDDFTDALESSKEAFYYWKSSLASDRSAALKAWHAAIIANQDPSLTGTQRKPSGSMARSFLPINLLNES